MRTTVTLHAETERLLRSAIRERGVSFKAALNDAVRKGLAPARSARSRRFVQKTCDLGASEEFQRDKALAMADAMEDEHAAPVPSHHHEAGTVAAPAVGGASH